MTQFSKEVSADKLVCPECGYSGEADLFLPKKLVKFCPKCGNEINIEAKFCKKCGYKSEYYGGIKNA